MLRSWKCQEAADPHRIKVVYLRTVQRLQLRFPWAWESWLCSLHCHVFWIFSQGWKDWVLCITEVLSFSTEKWIVNRFLFHNNGELISQQVGVYCTHTMRKVSAEGSGINAASQEGAFELADNWHLYTGKYEIGWWKLTIQLMGKKGEGAAVVEVVTLTLDLD